MIPRIAISSGEPAGIGPDLCLALKQPGFEAELVLLGDPVLFDLRAKTLGIDISLPEYQPQTAARKGHVCVQNISLVEDVTCGELNPANAHYVLSMLDRAIQGCTEGEFKAMVTAPIHKGIINDAGVSFTGHTEYLAEKTAAEQVVMMLATPGLRVALATTHLPLKQVAESLNKPQLEAVLRCLKDDLVKKFNIKNPRILVCGLNPHAGEGGHLGDEEQNIIQPVIDKLLDEGFDLEGPLPADTLFTPPYLTQADAVLAMYHDQGLPVLKHMGFGQAVNITLGLPVIRTSVDHGTALEIAGTGKAESGSLEAAIRCAIDLCT